MRPGQKVLVKVGFPPQELHVAAMVGVGAAMFLGGQITDTEAALDVNMGSNHLPQTYRLVEIIEMYDPKFHGLCENCDGFGLTTLALTGTIDEVLEGKAGDICPVCNGSGRTGIHYEVVVDEPGTKEVRVTIDPDYVDTIQCPTCKRAHQLTCSVCGTVLHKESVPNTMGWESMWVCEQGHQFE